MNSTKILSLKASEANKRTSAQVRAQDGKRFVARGIGPFARQAERSGKRVCGGGIPTCQAWSYDQGLELATV
jgi:hypothetical protein